jgi:putative ABC transport system permease protein
MNTSYLDLSLWQVALAASLILVNATISIALNLGLGRTLLLASLRTIVQLTLVGLVLQTVFQWDRWYAVVGLMAVMTLIAGITAAQRCERRYAGIWTDTIISVWASSWIIMAFTLLAVLKGIDSWYQPQYAIPIMGMLLGNTLSGISVGLNTFNEGVTTRRREIETYLALGATRWEAGRDAIQHAVRTGMIPIINSMMIVGIVSLPGMMTGQILSGTAPMQAVKYQIVIMFLIASSTALGTVGVVLLSFSRLFNAEHQFLPQRLKLPGNPP